MTSLLDPEKKNQVLTENVKWLLSCLATQGEARVVGGAVRDILLGRSIGDIDFATTLPPQKMIDVLAQSNIKTVPTGLAHGTITAVIDHVGYEITTLRRDVQTDGRHAEVAFTDDWQVDAARRDFTFNALYLDANGHIYDYFDGITDAKAGRVRFIGNAEERIREDVLRILRFFRFYAWFGQGVPDPLALSACTQLANLIPNLSAERVAREIIKLLAAVNPLPAWRLMREAGIVSIVAPAALDLERLQTVLDNEKKHNERTPALNRLAALLTSQDMEIKTLAEKLKLSNRETDLLVGLSVLSTVLTDNLKPHALRQQIYLFGVEKCRAAVFMQPKGVSSALEVISAWEHPLYPLKGEDVVKLGVPAGPRVGEILKEVEIWWMAENFKDDRAACLTKARELVLKPIG